MKNQENVIEFKVAKCHKLFFSIFSIIYFIFCSSWFFESSFGKKELLIFIFINLFITFVLILVIYCLYKMKTYFFEEKLVIVEALKKNKELKFCDITNIKFNDFNSFKLKSNKKKYFISDFMNDPFILIKLLYDKILEYNPELINEKQKSKFNKRFKSLLRRQLYNLWLSRYLILMLIISLSFAVIFAYTIGASLTDPFNVLSPLFLVSWIWILLSYHLYSFKFRKFIKSITIENSNDNVIKDFSERYPYSKYFNIFVIIFLVACSILYFL